MKLIVPLLFSGIMLLTSRNTLANHAPLQACDVPHTVCARAQELSADVLVIGRSSGSGLLGRLRTNAHSIIRGAHRPVVSVRVCTRKRTMFPPKQILKSCADCFLGGLCHLDYAQSATARRIDAVRLISYFALFY